MEALINARKLTVFVGADSRQAHQPLYEAVVDILRQHQVAGVTVLKGAMGYHGPQRVHYALNEITMENLPIIIEAVDGARKIEAAAEKIASVLGETGLVQTQSTTFWLRSGEEKVVS